MRFREWCLSLFLFALLFLFLQGCTSQPLTGFSTHDNQSNQSQRLACVGRTCTLVNESGPNLCATNLDCYNLSNVTVIRANRTIVTNLTNLTPVHLACVGQSCVAVEGAGPDLCRANLDCSNTTNQTHLACVGVACLPVSGIGPDECTSNFNCTNGSDFTGGSLSRRSIPVPSEPPPAPSPQPQQTQPAPTLLRFFLQWMGF